MENSVNPMKDMRIEKVTLSIATGGVPENVENAFQLAKRLTGCKPLKTLASRKARTFRMRRGLPIGVKVTMRCEKGAKFLNRVVEALDRKINAGNFDGEGNFSFGIKEYLDIPKEKYDPKLGVIGMNINVTLGRPGFRIKRRKMKKSCVSPAHRIKKEEAIEFAKKNLNISVI